MNAGIGDLVAANIVDDEGPAVIVRSLFLDPVQVCTGFRKVGKREGMLRRNLDVVFAVEGFYGGGDFGLTFLEFREVGDSGAVFDESKRRNSHGSLLTGKGRWWNRSGSGQARQGPESGTACGQVRSSIPA